MPAMNFLRLNVVFLILLSLAVKTAAAGVKTMPDYYFLDVRATDMHLAIKLNGAPLVQNNEGTGVVTSKPVANWLLKGENSLEVGMFALPDHDRLQGKLQVRIFLHDNTSDVPKAKEVLAQYDFPHEKNLSTDEKVVVEKFSFDVLSETPAKLWKEAEEQTRIGGESKKQIASLISMLSLAFAQKDAAKAVKLQMYKIHDDAAIEEKTAEQLVKATIFNYDWLFKQENLTVRSLDIEDMKFDLIANGKVVYVTHSNGGEAVEITSPGSRFEVPVYVSKIDGSWTVVR